MVDLPPSFFVVSVAVLIWGVVLVVTRDRGRRPGAPARGGHDRLPAVPERTR
jgi:zinc/manganese transport system permease protein